MKIKELILFTNNLKAQVHFYSKILELTSINTTSANSSFKIGESRLTFKYRKKSTPYHFAFNIPSNKDDEALNWLKERAELLALDGNKLIDFKSWNAKAMYFYDTDNNIVEFISRKDLNVHSEKQFSSESILNISEIGVGTTQIAAIYNTLNSLKKIEVFDGEFERFCAVGNNEGMFILGNSETKKWMPVNDKIHQSDFIIKGDYNFEYARGKIMKIK